MALSTKKTSLFPVLLLILLVKTAAIVWIRRFRPNPPSQYSYLGDDYPRAWPIPMTGPVHMPLENTVRYAIESPEADEEWRSMSPNDGIIHLGKHRRPFSISMFHQLRCIDILRKEMWLAQTTGVTKPDSMLNRHCVNYLRQMMFCTADSTLDVVRGPIAHPLVVPEFFTYSPTWRDRQH
ncbi:N-acetyltransferase domain-containing protein [Mycena indigotica]|uniref:N-acetyltransferase domain-containing protein n=1 Tax=Mycena indigotica TaxID=2126181 RepID=A0A8H6T933_9AGAR|nr:N-acetyltransferase domain-containing protein [Mycena indigotica]KAF7312207.1 N-acetyltransferase domain-containing protein [Mycena indigotica]